MNIILLFEEDFIAGNRVRVSDHRFQHMCRVQRIKPGDAVRVGHCDGLLGQGQVVGLDAQAVTLQVTLDQQPPPPSPLSLVMALPRPKMLRRCLRMVAEVGVKELHLINSYRVEKSFWQSPWLEPAEIQRNLVLGLQQARDTRLPQVRLHKGFKPFVEDQLPGLLALRQGWVAHPHTVDREAGPESGSEARSETGRPGLPVAEPTLICIGPEGGFIPYEVDKLIAAGCRPLDLGPRIYRVETVLPFLLGALSAELSLG